MTLAAKDKKTISEIRIKKAYEFLADSRANFKDSRYRTSVNRSYYAVLNAIRALLILEGVNPQTHEGIITMLSLRFVRPGLLPTTLIKSFKILLSRRTDVDYGDFETIDVKEAEDSLRIAEEMMEELNRVREEMVKSL